MVSSRVVNLKNGDYIFISYNYEGIFYDMYNKKNEHIEIIGFDLFEDIEALTI